MRTLIVSILVLTTALAGCSKEEPAAVVPTPVPRPTPEFTLGTFALFDADPVAREPPRLAVNYTTNVPLNFSLLDAAGASVGRVNGATASAGQTTIPLDSWTEIPARGAGLELTLFADDAVDGRKVHEQKIAFRGPAGVFPEPLEVEHVDGRITAVAGTIRNAGDLPAFVKGYVVDVGGVTLNVAVPDVRIVRLQPGESARYELEARDAGVYPPAGPFNVTLTVSFETGPVALGQAPFTHGVEVVSAKPVSWSAAGLESIEVVLRTSGNFPSSIGTFRWGFANSMSATDADELGHGDPWIAAPEREHKAVLTLPRGAVVYQTPNKTDLVVEIIDGAAQVAASSTFRLPAPRYDLVSPSASFTCPPGSPRPPCALDRLQFYVDPDGETPTYLSGFRVSVGNDRSIVNAGVEAGATSKLEKLVALDIRDIRNLAYGSTVSVKVDALGMDGTDGLSRSFDIKVM